MVNKPPEPLKSLIDKCFRCGLCRAVCPVFSQVGREPAVARGKLQVTRAMLEGEGEAPEVALFFLSRCMTCGLCQQTCPADVQVSDAIIRARALLIPTLDSIAAEHLERFPSLERWRRYLDAIRTSPDHPLEAILDLLSEIRDQKLHPTSDVSLTDKSLRPEQMSDPAMRVAYFRGCAETLFPQISRNALQILEKNRVQVLIPNGPRYCGALALEAGDLDAARQAARVNIEAFGGEDIAAIVAADATCARTLQRDYRELLGLDDFPVPVYHITQFLEDVLPGPLGFSPVPRKAIFFAARAADQAEDWSGKLLERIPELDVADIEDSNECCGESLYFSVLHPKLFDQIMEAKLAEVEASGCEMIITDSSICLMQLGWAVLDRGLNIEVKHIVEVLAVSLGMGSNSSKTAPRTARARKKC
jgi:glycolate oxidase iron-sulfur subunit